MTNAALRGKPDAGNPHVRFDEGGVAPAKPRRGSLLYKDVHGTRAALVAIGLALGWAALCPAASNLSPIVPFVVPTDRPTAAEVDGASSAISTRMASGSS